ncbi:DUF892 family protein, partial [Rhizobium ruizarguesonis]
AAVSEHRSFRAAAKELLVAPSAISHSISSLEEIMEEFKGTAALDAGLISAAQAVEHYEIARYGKLKTWAATLGLKEVVGLLDQKLQQETA